MKIAIPEFARETLSYLPSAKLLATSQIDRTPNSFENFCAVIVENNLELIHLYSQSPIETIFFSSLAVAFGIHGAGSFIVVPPFKFEDFSANKLLFDRDLYRTLPPLRNSVHLCLQPSFKQCGKNIRADAAIWVPGKPSFKKLIIECDGFQFHSSPESFIKDRKRDRNFIAAGYEVLRYSGSEIHADPIESACSLQRLLAERFDLECHT